MSEQSRSIVDDIIIFPGEGGWIAEPFPTSAYPQDVKARGKSEEIALYRLAELIEKDDRLTLANEVNYTVFPF